MKRIARFVVIIIVCTLALCACSNKSNSSILIAGISEGNSFISSDQVDIDLSYAFEKKSLVNSFEYEIDNEIVFGSYVKTLLSPYYNCNADVYNITTIDGKEIEFRVNQRTNKVVAYMIAYRDGCKTTSNKSYEECLQIAKQKLFEFDSGEYVQVFKETHLKAVHIPECGDVFSYFFRKEYNGKQTTILVQVDVNTNGTVVQVNATDINEFDNEDVLVLNNYSQNDNLVIEEVRRRVAFKLKNEEIENVSFEIKDSLYCKLEDGNMYILYDILIKSAGSDEYDYVRVLKKL